MTKRTIPTRDPEFWFEFTPNWLWEPMAFWVHVPVDERHQGPTDARVPAGPAPIPHRGYPVLCTEFEGVVLRFSSHEQVEEFVRVMQMRPLPTSRKLSALRHEAAGPNSHWLSRLPPAVKATRARPRIVERLRRILDNYPSPEPSIVRDRLRPKQKLTPRAGTRGPRG